MALSGLLNQHTGTGRMSVLIPWRERDELAHTLSLNVLWMQPLAAELLLLNCAGDKNRLHEILSSPFRNVHGRTRQIDINWPTFNKSLALNVGIHLSRSPIILVLDADVWLDGSSVDKMLQCLESTSFVTVAEVQDYPKSRGWLTGDSQLQLGQEIQSVSRAVQLNITWKDGSTTSVEATRRDGTLSSRSGPGLLLANKTDLIKVGGYNSDLRGWGGEDIDVLLRLDKCLGRTRSQAGRANHLLHGDDIRDLRGISRNQSNANNLREIVRRYSHGKFEGTLTRDVGNPCDFWVESVV
jgi:glycosyltransferase involved in cell wall biosynthesis